MPDVPLSSENCENTQPSQSFCIDAYKVYDSCGDKDCLSDMRVYFTEENQSIISEATSVRIMEVNIVNSVVRVCPVTYHCGFYSVDITFYFDVVLDVNSCNCPCSGPNTVNGLSVFSKRVILYGGDSRVGVFTSDCESSCVSTECANVPIGKVQVAQPMALTATLVDVPGTIAPPSNIPDCVIDYFGGSFVPATVNSVLATFGVFTIVQLERAVQMLIPAYDYCVPNKECVTSTDNPCDMFSKIDFPSEQFFPPNLADATDSNGSCCNTCKD